MKKLIRKLDSKIIAARIRFDELMSKEDGMQTLEMVLLIIVGIIVAGLVVELLTGKDGNGGLIRKLFNAIEKKLSNSGLGITLE